MASQDRPRLPIPPLHPSDGHLGVGIQSVITSFITLISADRDEHRDLPSQTAPCSRVQHHRRCARHADLPS